jgi:hypothetical protein
MTLRQPPAPQMMGAAQGPPPAQPAPAPAGIGGMSPPATVGGFAAGGIPDRGAQYDHTMPPGHQGRPLPKHPYHVNGLPDAATGGHIPYELSPSHGHTTDDVVANLNAGEFVIPRRVVHHMGNKFFYDVIAKSDKESGLHPQPVGPEPLKKGSGADKARDSAEGGKMLNGGGI